MKRNFIHTARHHVRVYRGAYLGRVINSQVRRLSGSLCTVVMIAGVLVGSPVDAQMPEGGPGADPLELSFLNPPASARPLVWWHWVNGNVTKDGIRRDLEWMKRVGIAGVQNFDVDLAAPSVTKKLVYMTPQWKDAFHSAAELADRLGLELAIAASPGWSETGGPWVQPRNAMKKLVWSEISLGGGKHFIGRLPAPPTVTGPFQSIPKNAPGEAIVNRELTYYADIAVLAYPIANIGELPLPQVSSVSGEPIDASKLNDRNLTSTIEIERGTTERPATLLLSYPTPQTVRSAVLYVPGKDLWFETTELPRLEASTDGSTWEKVADIPVDMVPTTVSFAPVKARQFRLVIAPGVILGLSPEDIAPGLSSEWLPAISPPLSKSVKIAELRLSGRAQVDRFETKAGFSVARDYYALNSVAGEDTQGVATAAVIDLTRRMKADGTLDWTPPKGEWRVLRLGCSLQGVTNHPTTAEATGLEVDKFDGPAVRTYLETYLNMYRDTTGADLIGEHGLRALVTDSIEVGPSNWTPRMVDQFKKLRGYDPTPWLPALTGVIIGSRSASDAFLYDYRRTLADLIASEHYGTVAAVAHEYGLKVYGEALEDGRPSLGDDMSMRSHTDIPMGAMWTYGRQSGPRATYVADIKGAASVAHLYGQNLVAGESLTSQFEPWADAPKDLRRIIDLEFATGVNRPVIHVSVHQPVDDRVPGLGSIFGQYFNRHETWAEMARPWIDYIARSSYLLQQGQYFADVAYFYGEEAPLTGLYTKNPVSDAPIGYAYDFVSADALLNQLQVDSGDIVTKSGAHYRVLYLGGSSQHMTLPVLRRLVSLVEAGATVVGEAPQSSPSREDDRATFDAIVRHLWSGQRVTSVGLGKVISSKDIESALLFLGLGPDFRYSSPEANIEVLFLHRHLADGEVYYLSNRKNRAEHFEARFRLAGKAPQIWRADSGVAEPISYRMEGAETIVPLDMEAEESFFVVFRQPADAPARTVDKAALSPLATLEGSWNVSLQPKHGDSMSITLASLGSLSKRAEPAVKYFSGVATYRKSFELPKSAQPGTNLLLDLGDVGDLAEVYVNGNLMGTVWHPPYRLDIGSAVKHGSNQLAVRVADLWVNRLIGDAQPGAKKVAYTSIPTYGTDAPLRPSGLLGPVQLLAQRATNPAEPAAHAGIMH